LARGTRTDKSSAVSGQPECLRTPQLSVSPVLFRKFQQLIYAETGIWLGASKTALLCGRLFRRLLILGISSLQEYYELVAVPDGHEERGRMIDAITTNETRFFREPRQFEFLVQEVIPRWKTEAEEGLRPKRVRIWSAGCSSGEEPYTLAMLLAEHLSAEASWDIGILATDISHRVLERAGKGIYDVAKAEDIPKEVLRKFMIRGFADQQGRIKVRVDIQAMVEFRRLNLNHSPYAVEGPYDAIFCRNVLIYFNAESRQRAVLNLVSHLAAEGFLFVGHAENLTSLSAQLRSVEPTIYIKKAADADRGANAHYSSTILNEPERRKAIAASAGK